MKTKSTWTSDIMKKFDELQEAIREGCEYDQDELDEKLDHTYIELKKEDINKGIEVDVDPKKIWVESDDDEPEEEEYTLNEKLDMVLDELATIHEVVTCLHEDVERIEKAIKLHGR